MGDAVEAARLWEQTGGNPFLIRELVHAVDDGGVPAGIREAVDCRLLRLSGTARKLICAAARVGYRFDAAALSGDPADAVAEALTEAVRIGLITHVASSAGRFVFRHPILHRALLASTLTAA